MFHKNIIKRGKGLMGKAAAALDNRKRNIDKAIKDAEAGAPPNNGEGGMGQHGGKKMKKGKKGM